MLEHRSGERAGIRLCHGGRLIRSILWGAPGSQALFAGMAADDQIGDGRYHQHHNQSIHHGTAPAIGANPVSDDFGVEETGDIAAAEDNGNDSSAFFGKPVVDDAASSHLAGKGPDKGGKGASQKKQGQAVGSGVAKGGKGRAKEPHRRQLPQAEPFLHPHIQKVRNGRDNLVDGLVEGIDPAGDA